MTIDKFWIETSFVLLLAISLCISFFRNREIQAGFVRFLLFFCPYVLINVASLLYTWNRFNTLGELNVTVWVLGCVYLFMKSEKKDSLLAALILGASLTVACMIVQYELLLPKLGEVLKGGRYGSLIQEKAVPFSSYLNEATLGGFFLFTIPLSVYFSVIQKKVLYTFLTPVLILGLLVSLSRMGILLGALSIIASAVFIYRKKGAKGLATLGVIFFIASSAFAMVLYTGSQQQKAALQETAFNKAKRIPEHIGTLTYRTVTWKRSLDAFLNKPIAGYGSGAFEYAYRKYYEAELYTKYAHSILIKIIVELGLVGLACYLFYLSGLAAEIKKHFKDAKHFFIFLSIASAFCFSLFSVTFEIPAYAVTFFVLSSAFFLSDQKIKRGTGFIFISATAVLLGSFFFTARADFSQKMCEDAVIYQENGLPAQAFATFREAVNSMPLNNNAHIGVLGLLVRSFQMEHNLHHKEEIRDMLVKYLPRVDANPDKNSELFLLSGIAHGLLGEQEEAERRLGEAMRYYPSSAYYLYETANFYFLRGNLEMARLLTQRMENYADKYKGSDLHGLYVYKMRDLQSSIEYQKGDREKALSLAKENLHQAENDNSVIDNIHAREYVSKVSFVNYFRSRVEFYESTSKRGE